MHPDWQWHDVVESLVEKRNDGEELRASNILLELCTLIKRVCNFNIMNFFTFYGIIMNKISVKTLFTLFQWFMLRLMKVAPSQLNPNALFAFKFLCMYFDGLHPTIFCFFYLFNYFLRTHERHIYFNQRLDTPIYSLRFRIPKKGGKILLSK